MLYMYTHTKCFMDTLSGTWNKVKSFVTDSPLAQKVVKQGLSEGKRIARGVADAAVKAGVDYLPESFRGPVEGLAAEALDKLGDSAERAAEQAIINPQTARVPAAAAAKALPAAAVKSSKRRKMKGAGHAAGLMGPEPFTTGGFVTAPAFDASMLPAGATTVSSTNHLQRAY